MPTAMATTGTSGAVRIASRFDRKLDLPAVFHHFSEADKISSRSDAPRQKRRRVDDGSSAPNLTQGNPVVDLAQVGTSSH